MNTSDPLDTTTLITAIVTLVTALLAVPPIVIQLVRTLKRERTAAELETLRQIATASVQAIEQLNKKTGMTSNEKLLAAIDLAATQLTAYGINITQDQLRAAIESAVLLMNAGLKLPPPPVDPQTTEPTPVP